MLQTKNDVVAIARCGERDPQTDGFYERAKGLKISLMTVGVAMSTGVGTAAATGAAVDSALPYEYALMARILLAFGGAGTAVLLYPPEARRAMLVRLWSGSFGGVMATPWVRTHEWLSGSGLSELNEIMIAASLGGFLLYFILELAAKILGSPSAPGMVSSFLEKWFGTGRVK